jgi:hypothetical protein
MLMSNLKFESHGFPQAMRLIRKAKGVTQEDFGVVSSRTYVSSVERVRIPAIVTADSGRS